MFFRIKALFLKKIVSKMKHKQKNKLEACVNITNAKSGESKHYLCKSWKIKFLILLCNNNNQ